jgi:hypothetical protein
VEAELQRGRSARLTPRSLGATSYFDVLNL